jgi:predicted RNA-binding Zn-ribbon protein involved in translation (DUF1610 family)
MSAPTIVETVVQDVLPPSLVHVGMSTVEPGTPMATLCGVVVRPRRKLLKFGMFCPICQTLIGRST